MASRRRWTRDDAAVRGERYSEIDFIVVNRLVRLIAIKQKNRPVAIGSDDLVKTYGTDAKDIRDQVTRNLHDLMQKFGRRCPGRRLDVDYPFPKPHSLL